jgi:hypothetical protein
LGTADIKEGNGEGEGERRSGRRREEKRMGFMSFRFDGIFDLILLMP